MGGDKNRERSLTSYCHGQNRLNFVKPVEFTVQQIRVRQWKINPNLKKAFPPPVPSSWLKLHSLFFYLTLQQCRGWRMGTVVSSSHAAPPSPGEELFTLSLCSDVDSSHRILSPLSFSSVSPPHQLQCFTTASAWVCFMGCSPSGIDFSNAGFPRTESQLPLDIHLV